MLMSPSIQIQHVSGCCVLCMWQVRARAQAAHGIPGMQPDELTFKCMGVDADELSESLRMRLGASALSLSSMVTPRIGSELGRCHASGSRNLKYFGPLLLLLARRHRRDLPVMKHAKLCMSGYHQRQRTAQHRWLTRCPSGNPKFG